MRGLVDQDDHDEHRDERDDADGRGHRRLSAPR
jgi:hypothetical protein